MTGNVKEDIEAFFIANSPEEINEYIKEELKKNDEGKIIQGIYMLTMNNYREISKLRKYLKFWTPIIVSAFGAYIAIIV